MAVGVSGFNETEAFEEYNTHPYKGGYDIVLTYGTPLPPSPSICYPMSDASSYPPLIPQVPLPSVPVEPPAMPEASERAIPNSVRREGDLPEAVYGSSYGYDECGFATVDWWWNLSGFSPYMIAADGNVLGGCRYDVEELRYWGQLRRAADYIFGHSQGFGERRIGVDSLGIPIYAYKRHANDTVHVEIEPARTGKLDYHCDSLRQERCSSTCNNREDENYAFSSLFNMRHQPEEPLHTEADSVECVFSWKPSQSGLYDQVNPENHGIDYNTHYYGGSQNVQMEAVEISNQILSYPEISGELAYTDSVWEPSYKGHGDENNTFTSTYYEGQEYQQPSQLELEPYRPSWVQCPGYYGFSEEAISVSRPQTSSLGEWINDEFCSSDFASTHHDGRPLELEPFKPTWALNPNYYGSYEEISAPYK